MEERLSILLQKEQKYYGEVSVFVVCIVILDSEVKLPVSTETQEKTSQSLQKLVEQLQFFRTSYENKTKHYNRVADTEQYLQKVNDQVSQYNNVLVREQNSVEGSKHVIVGSFNTIKGCEDYVFIEKQSGQANGDLLIGQWRIEIEKKKLILVDFTFSISFINEETNIKYLRFQLWFNQQRDNLVTFTNSFNYGSTNPYQYSQNANYVQRASIDAINSDHAYSKDTKVGLTIPNINSQQSGRFQPIINTENTDFMTSNTDSMISNQNSVHFNSAFKIPPEFFIIPGPQLSLEYASSNFIIRNSVIENSYSSNLRLQPQVNGFNQTLSVSNSFRNNLNTAYLKKPCQLLEFLMLEILSRINSFLIIILLLNSTTREVGKIIDGLTSKIYQVFFYLFVVISVDIFNQQQWISQNEGRGIMSSKHLKTLIDSTENKTETSKENLNIQKFKNSRQFKQKSHFLINSWKGSSELIVIHTIPNDKVRTFQTNPVYHEIFLLVRSVHKDSNFQRFWLTFQKQSYELRQSNSSVSHVFKNKDMFSVKFIRVEISLDDNFTGAFLSLIRGDSDKITNHIHVESSYNIGIEHKCSFEEANSNNFDGLTIVGFSLKFRVEFVDFIGNFLYDSVAFLFIIEFFERESVE